MRIPATGSEPCVPTTALGVAAIASGSGFTLIAGTTYYVALGGEDATQVSITLAPANALLITSLALEVANLPLVSEISTTAGEWHVAAPEDVVFDLTGTVADTAGAFPLSKTNGAGTGLVTLPTFPWRRGRLAIVVGATGGVLTLACQAKG